jgi:hypothetical protein
MSEMQQVWGKCIGETTLHAATLLSCFYLGTPLERVAFRDVYKDSNDVVSITVNNEWDINNPSDQESLLLFILSELIRLKREQNFNFVDAEFKTENKQRYAYFRGFFGDTDGRNITSVVCSKIYPKESDKDFIRADLIFIS